VNPGQDVDPDGNPINQAQHDSNEEEWQEKVLHAEMNVYEEFASRYCKGVVNAPVVCLEVKEMFDELSHELQAVTRGSVSAADRKADLRQILELGPGWSVYARSVEMGVAPVCHNQIGFKGSKP
jgi:hypothetical protein